MKKTHTEMTSFEERLSVCSTHGPPEQLYIELSTLVLGTETGIMMERLVHGAWWLQGK